MKKYYSLVLLFLCSSLAIADVFYVTSTADDATGGFLGPQGTLRWAIYESNQNPGLDYIYFDLKDDGQNVIDANGVFVITMSINYQQMGYNGAVIIDGYTQPGATVGNPKVRIIGSNNDVFQFVQDNADGPRDASGSVVRGFYLGPVNSFSISILGADDILIEDVWVGVAPDGTPVNNTGQSKGITITGANCGVGCPSNPDAICHNITIRNAVFSSNALMGIDTWRTEGLHISNSYIGTNKDGTTSVGFGNSGAGIWCGESENSIIENCVIAGNDNSSADANQASTGGINIYSGENIIIRDNIIGATTNGIAAGNGNFGIIVTGGNADGNGPATGVQILNNSILNTTAGRDPGHGVLLANSNTTANTIQGNIIRNNATHGIIFANAEVNTNVVGAPVGSSNATLRNVITGNGGDGINVSEGDFNTLRINSVYCNSGDKEHDLNGGTGNEGHPAPVFTSVASIQPVTGTANAGDVIDFYAMSTCKTCSPTLQGDGLRWLGSAIASGGTFSYTGPVAESVIATATNSNGSTSEFSSCVQLFDECVPPIVAVGDDIEICGADLGANKVSLQGSYPLEFEEGTWTVESGLNTGTVTFGDLNSNLTTIDGLTSGDYVIRWTVVNSNPAFLDPCEAFAELTITVDEIPDAANAGEWQFLCEGAETMATVSANIPANGTGLWSWISSPQGTISSPTDATTTVSGLSVGNNALRWTIDSDLGICPSEVNDILIVIEEIISVGPDISQCGASPPVSVNISANTVPTGSPTILWEQLGAANGITIQNPWDQHPWLNNVPAGTHQFTYTVDGGNCPDTLTVTVGGTTPSAVAGDDQTICDDNTMLEASPDPDGADGVWTQVSGGTYSISDDTDPTAEVSGLSGDYIFQWTVTNACASDDDQVSISVGSSTPIPTVDSPVTYCVDDAPASLLDAVTSGTNLLWYSGLTNGTGISTVPTVSTAIGGSTSYFVSQTVGGCESERAEIEVVVNEIPVITNTELVQTICSGDLTEAITFTSSVTGTSFNWTSLGVNINGTIDDGGGAVLATHNPTYSGSNDQGVLVYSVVPEADNCVGDPVDFTISIDMRPEMDSYLDGVSLCGNNVDLTVVAVAFGTGEWRVISGPGDFNGSSSSSSTTVTVTDLDTSTDTEVIWEVSNGICPIGGDSVLIHRFETPQITNADLDQTICSGDLTESITFLSSVSGTSFEWASVETDVIGSLADGTGPSLNSHELSFSGASGEQGNVVYTVTPSSNGCIGDDVEFTILVDRNPELTAYLDNIELCGETTTLNATSVSFGTAGWTVLNGSGSFGGSISSTNAVETLDGLTPGSVTNVIWEVSNGVCPALGDSVSVSSVLSVSPDVTLSAPVEVCEGDEVVFNATANTNGIFTLFETGTGIGSPDYISASNENSMSFTVTASTSDLDYTVSFEGMECVASGATNPVSDDTQVEVHLLPSGQANIIDGNELTTCASEVDLTAGEITVNNGAGRWEVLVGPAALTNDLGNSTTVFDVSSPGTAEIVWIVSTNALCPEDTAKFIINQLGTVTAPDLDANVRGYCGTNSLPQLIHQGGVNADESMIWSVSSVSQGATTIDGVSGQVMSAEAGQTNIYELAISKTADPTCDAKDTIHVFFWEEPSQATVNDADIETCSDPITLSGIASTPSTTTGIWTVTSGACSVTTGQAELPNAQLANLTSGESCVVRWTVSNGLCVEHSFADVTVDKLADITKATIGVSGDASQFFSADGLMDLCIDGSYFAEPSTPSSDEVGVWEIVAGATDFINESRITNQELVLTQLEVTTLKWKISKTGALADVCPADSIVVSFDVFGLPVAEISDPVNGASYCSNETVSFLGTASNGLGVWTIPVSSTFEIGDVSSNSISLNDLDTGTHELMWTVENGVCSPDVASVTVEIIPIENVSIALPAGEVLCQGTSFDLAAIVEGQGNGIISWSGHPDVLSQTGTDVTVSDLMNGDYTITATVNSDLQCPSQPSASTDYNLTVVDGPNPDVVENDITACAGISSITLTADYEVGNSIQWQSVVGGTMINETSSLLPVLSAGAYFFYEDNGVCNPVASDTVEVDIIEVPYVEAPEFFAMYAGDVSFIEATISGVFDSVSWSGASFIDDINSIETAVTPQLGEGGLYELTIYVANGPCGRSDQFTIAVREPLQIPNAFTPNEDGDHDLWDIKGIETYPEAYIRIFNRWGNLLYEHYGYEIWDGTFNGKELPVATYYYVINLNAAEDPDAESLSGHVTIIR